MIELSNGVVVEIEDKTSVLSGDLYMVHLKITTSVRLVDEDFELKRYCNSDRLRKTRVLKKSAVHERVLEEVKETIKQSFLDTNRPYMEHPKFIDRFKHTCLNAFREQEEKARRAKDP